MLLSLNLRFFGFLFDQILHFQISTWPQEGIVGMSIEYIPPLLDQTFGIQDGRIHTLIMTCTQMLNSDQAHPM